MEKQSVIVIFRRQHIYEVVRLMRERLWPISTKKINEDDWVYVIPACFWPDAAFQADLSEFRRRVGTVIFVDIIDSL